MLVLKYIGHLLGREYIYIYIYIYIKGKKYIRYKSTVLRLKFHSLRELNFNNILELYNTTYTYLSQYIVIKITLIMIGRNSLIQ